MSTFCEHCTEHVSTQQHGRERGQYHAKDLQRRSGKKEKISKRQSLLRASRREEQNNKEDKNSGKSNLGRNQGHETQRVHSM